MKTQYLALLGFFPPVEKKIKHVIENSLNDNIVWSSATDEGLCGVVINAKFLLSPHIANYISETSANVVSCYKKSEEGKVAIDAGIPALKLFDFTPDELRTWLLALGEDVSFSEKMVKKEDIERTGIKTKVKEIKQKEIKPQPTVARVPQKDEDLCENYSLLIDNLEKSKQYIYAVSENCETWIDVDNNAAHINYDLDSIPKIDELSWKVCDTLSFDESFYEVQLDLWLFESIWLSNIDIDKHVIPENSKYQLCRWPRPLSSWGRSEVLRLAAFAQYSDSTIKCLKKKTGYSGNLVRRFVYAALTSGHLTIVGSNAKMKSKKIPTDTEKLRLIDRLRQKFGLSDTSGERINT